MKTTKFIFSPNEQHVTKSPSTNKIILDYLLYLSIQSRLKQARVELLELSEPLPLSKEDNTLEIRKQRWQDTASKAEQDKNAVESIVAGKKKKSLIELITRWLCNSFNRYSIQSLQ
jgi:hypothetical protein